MIYPEDKGVEPAINQDEPKPTSAEVSDAMERNFIGRGARFFALTGDILSPIAPDWEEGTDI